MQSEILDLQALTFNIAPRIQSRIGSRMRKEQVLKNKVMKERTSMKEQAAKTLKSHTLATKLIKESTIIRESLNCKFSVDMHRKNLEDFKLTRSYTKPLDPGKIATWESYVKWNEKLANSTENPEFRLHQLALLYGPASYWGKIEETERLRLEGLNAHGDDYKGPDTTPVEHAHAIYTATKNELLVATNVKNALSHDTNQSAVEDLLIQAKAVAVLQRAVRIFRKRSWARKFAQIDPALKELVEEEAEVEKHIKEEARLKVEMRNGGGGSIGGSSAFGSPVPRTGQSRQRSNTGMSEITFSSRDEERVTPEKHRSAAAPRSAASGARYNSVTSFRQAGSPSVSSVLGDAANSTAAESLKKLNTQAAVAHASNDALELQTREVTRRVSVLQDLRNSIRSPNQQPPFESSTAVNQALSPAEKITRRATLLLDERPFSASAANLGANNWRSRASFNPLSTYDNGARNSFTSGTEVEERRQNIKRPSTAGDSRGNVVELVSLYSSENISKDSKVRPRTAKVRFGTADAVNSAQQLTREIERNRLERSGSRRRGPRTLAKTKQAIAEQQGKEALDLLRRRSTGIKKVITQGGMNKQQTARNLIARAELNKGKKSL